MAASSDRQTAFKREVASRFGLVPNFFSSAPDAPELVAKLWDFAKAGYLDNPLPSLFKEGCSSISPGFARFATASCGIARSCWGSATLLAIRPPFRPQNR